MWNHAPLTPRRLRSIKFVRKLNNWRSSKPHLISSPFPLPSPPYPSPPLITPWRSVLESRLGRSRLLSYSSGVSPTVLCSTLYVFICRGGAGSFWLRKRSPGVKGASRAQLGRGEVTPRALLVSYFQGSIGFLMKSQRGWRGWV